MSEKLLLQKQQWILFLQNNWSDNYETNENKLKEFGVKTITFTEEEKESWKRAYESLYYKDNYETPLSYIDIVKELDDKLNEMLEKNNVNKTKYSLDYTDDILTTVVNEYCNEKKINISDDGKTYSFIWNRIFNNLKKKVFDKSLHSFQIHDDYLDNIENIDYYVDEEQFNEYTEKIDLTPT